MSRDRLQKIVARAGLSSRRGAEELITSGRVRVNGRVVTELGTQADMRNDRIEVDGKRLVPELFVYVLLHKPRKVVSTRHDPEGRPTVTELVTSVPASLYPVGRLDFHTSGALLLTNDGEFTQGLLHPRQGVPKVYVAKVQGEMTEKDLERWRQGIQLDDGMTAPCEATLLRYEGDKTWIEITLHEGRNQQIRRMGEASGFPIMRLARLSFAGISTEGLRPGQFRLLESDELRDLKERYGVPKRIHKQQVAIDPTRRPSPRQGGFGDDDETPPRRESRTRIDARGTAHTDTRDGARGGRSGARTASRDDARGARPEPRGPRDDARAPGRPTRSSRPSGDDRPTRPARAARPSGDERPARTERPAGRPAPRGDRFDDRPTRVVDDRPSADRRPAREPYTKDRPNRDRPAREPYTKDRPNRDRPARSSAPAERPAREPYTKDRPARERPGARDQHPNDRRADSPRPGTGPRKPPRGR